MLNSKVLFKGMNLYHPLSSELLQFQVELEKRGNCVKTICMCRNLIHMCYD